MNWEDRYRPRGEPDCTLRVMRPADIPGVIQTLRQVGWTQQPADVERLLAWSPEGCFVIEEEGRGIVGTASTTPYGVALAWIGLVVVAPDRQGRGLGRQLVRAALDHLIARETHCVMLDSTEVGRPLYENLGFRGVGRVERWEGRASTYLGPRARRMRSEDVAAVLELDTTLFGVQRTHILIRLLEEFPTLAWVDYQHGKPEGYLLGRPMMNGFYLGPWMSRDAAAAERLLLAALEQLQGQQIALNIPDNNGRALLLAGNHNLRRVRHCTRMVYKNASLPTGDPIAQYAITSLATG